jgi:LytR cell envelope-related transcriptional attenuator
VTLGDRLNRAWPSLVALLGTVVVVFGLLVLFGDDGQPAGGDDAAADPATPGATTSAGATAPPTESSVAPVTAPPELRAEVGILNGTAVPGLAAQAQETLEAGGWPVPATDTYSGEIAVTTVYYPPGDEESAQALAAQFPEIKAVEPTIPGLTDIRLVLILADDYAAAVETTG